MSSTTSAAGGSHAQPLYQRDPLRAIVTTISPDQISYDPYVLCIAARSPRDNDPRCGTAPAGAKTWVLNPSHGLTHAQVAPSARYASMGPGNAPTAPTTWAENFLDSTLKQGPVTNFRAALTLDNRGRVTAINRYAPNSNG